MNVSVPKSEDVINRAAAAYKGLAVGDALGATVEFMTPREIQAQHKVHRDIVGAGWLNLKAGAVTDDTQMSLYLGRAILKARFVDPLMIAQYFSDWMASKPVDIGNTVRRGIVQYRQKGQIQVALNEYDGGNGACMRTLPISLCSLGQDEEHVGEKARLQSHVTHNNPLSDAGTLAVIKMVQLCLTGQGSVLGLKTIANDLVASHPEFRFDKKRQENPSGFIVDTLKAVFQSLFDTDNFEDCLIDVVNRGGDADTTGAITGMIAGAFYGAPAIPKRWLKVMDKKVLAECEDQARQLIGLSSLCREKP